MKPVLIWIGWIATLPGLALAAGVVATLAGVPEAVGCAPERMLALRCPETLLGSAARDLHDLGVITMLAPHLFIWPVLYTVGFPLARPGSAMDDARRDSTSRARSRATFSLVVLK